MAFSVASLRTTAANVTAANRPVSRPAAFARPTRVVLMRAEIPDKKGTFEPDNKSDTNNPFDVPRTSREAPFSEDKQAATPEQAMAPEGDRAVAGQAYQPGVTGESKTSPDEKVSSSQGPQQSSQTAASIYLYSR
eukprot:GHRR01013354.1.p1 GENE.GHRR01013354.1~~GHRR01013354.1.p1  ORF type:complete len:135 (-),score=28.87 GHRR01013354.1:21-425(-)